MKCHFTVLTLYCNFCTKFIKNETELLLTGEGADDIFLGYYKNVESDLSAVLQMYVTRDYLNNLFGKKWF